MKFENTSVFNFEGALRGMRNPMESWDKSDSGYCCDVTCCDCPLNGTNRCDETIPDFSIGFSDLKLAQKLIRAGSEHRKFMRQIFVSVDITAPLYWWKEFDTYKVGTVANSTSTMHKLASTPITIDCFEMDDFDDVYSNKALKEATLTSWWNLTIEELESLRQRHNKSVEDKRHLEEIKDFEEAKKAQAMSKKYWKELIRLLPESWLQTRTVTMDYENLFAICSKGQRRFHKLTEWSTAFISWARTLPYAQELIFIDELEEK